MKETYTLRLYSKNPNEPKGRIISFDEVGKVKEKIDNVLTVETEKHTVGMLFQDDNGELLCFSWRGGVEVSAWVYRKIEGIELKDDFSDSDFNFVNPN